MKVSIKRKDDSGYALAKLGHGEQYDARELEILFAGKIPMLLSPQSDPKKKGALKYDTSPYITLDTYLSYGLSKERFTELLLRFIQLFRFMKKEYLNYKYLVLELDKVFVLYVDRTIHLIYLPMVDSKREASMPDFFQEIISAANRKEHNQANYINTCEQWLKRPQPFVLDEFEAFIKQLSMTEKQSATPSYKQELVLPNIPRRPDMQTNKEEYSDIRNELREISARLSSDNTANEESAGKRFYLTREKTGERIHLSTLPFLIGAELGKVNYCISGNGTVSRKHALFCTDNGECVIIDQKSTNGTSVNGHTLLPFGEKVLADGDTIRIATETFVFSKE